MKWTKSIDNTEPTMFVVADVFRYLKEEQILKLITELKKDLKIQK